MSVTGGPPLNICPDGDGGPSRYETAHGPRLKGTKMNLIIEILITDASERARENILSEVRNMLSGQGFNCGDAVATFDPAEGSTTELASMGGSSAAIRLHEIG